MYLKKITTTCFVSLVFLSFFSITAAAGEESGDDLISYSVRSLVFATALYPGSATQNPENAFLQIYRYSGEFDLRPDFFLDHSAANGVFKPRFIAKKEWGKDGILDGETKSQQRAFVNEWRLQAKPAPILFLSFGKEKLLWGPAFLSSPSNALFKDIEKVNPKTEVEGKYLARVIWMPNNVVTVNAMTETRKEENELRQELKPLRAVKTDLIGSNYLASVILYSRQDDRFRMGSFAQWTVSDALILYYDGIVTRGTDALYPIEDNANPVGGGFVRKYDDSNKLFTTVTVGGAYTFLSNATLSIEFLNNEEGYTDTEAAAYYRIRGRASGHFFDGGMISGLSRLTLNEALNTGQSFLRKYYLMGQLQLKEIKNVVDVILRYVYSTEEHASQASSILEWQISDRFQFFNINTVAIDSGKETEFNSLIDKSFMVGIEAHF